MELERKISRRERERLKCRGRMHFTFQETKDKTIHSDRTDTCFTSSEVQTDKRFILPAAAAAASVCTLTYCSPFTLRYNTILEFVFEICKV